ncbi:hypothetical protein KXQ82_15885 [Mucilaginibacter sp. HMF5004]|uniref:hypothetical protein n=1 Tax=Mucilaginibacter rivuli TaxID=2857527 RepID=UPI001C5DD730|nr:hypothetical protein [Mucilaginibacter rivuli]MBW4891207.1 hypothetical protein [Mucilaginibacter rivuli]
MANKDSRLGLVKLTLLSGLLVGTLDMTAACINAYLSFGLNPTRVFKYIAAGVLGKSAFAGGALVDVLGVLLHYFIACSWTAFFFFIYPRTNLVNQNKYITGTFYGVLIWMVMNLVVVPLTNVPKPKNGFNVTQAYINAGILIAVIGIPLSLIAYRYFRKLRGAKR